MVKKIRKENTKTIGERSEAQIIAMFLRQGKVVLQPFGDNQRYDLVLDENGIFKRVQVKTGKLKNGVILFYTSSSIVRSKMKKRSYVGEVEFFAVYCPQNDKCYLIPIEATKTSVCSLRLNAPKNKQIKGILWAKDYEMIFNLVD